MENQVKVLKHLLLKYDRDQRWMASELGLSLQTIRNEFSKGSFTINKYEQMLKLFDAELVVITKDGQIFR